MSSKLAILAAALAAGGCVTRTMEIRSDPPGAAVWVNHRYVGRTPVENLEFAHYGSYQVALRREGCLAKTVTERVYAPWFEHFPVDFFSEILLPARGEVRRRFDYILEPVTLRPPEEVLAEAEKARAELRELAAPSESLESLPGAVRPQGAADRGRGE